jgi:hypothetical protein
MADSELSAVIGTEYARMMHKILPKIEDALKRGHLKAGFTVAAKFNVNKATGGVDVILSQTATIPLDDANFKLSFNSGQLSLFEESPGLPTSSAP